MNGHKCKCLRDHQKGIMSTGMKVRPHFNYFFDGYKETTCTVFVIAFTYNWTNGNEWRLQS